MLSPPMKQRQNSTMNTTVISFNYQPLLSPSLPRWSFKYHPPRTISLFSPSLPHVDPLNSSITSPHDWRYLEMTCSLVKSGIRHSNNFTISGNYMIARVVIRLEDTNFHSGLLNFPKIHYSAIVVEYLFLMNYFIFVTDYTVCIFIVLFCFAFVFVIDYIIIFFMYLKWNYSCSFYEY